MRSDPPVRAMSQETLKVWVFFILCYLVITDVASFFHHCRSRCLRIFVRASESRLATVPSGMLNIPAISR